MTIHRRASQRPAPQHSRVLAAFSMALCLAAVPLLGQAPAASPGAAAAGAIPRTSDGKPNLQGIWQVRNRAAFGLESHHASLGIMAGLSVVEGGEIPYQPWALKKRNENFAERQSADPLSKCYMAGVPRIMYLNYPIQIFQTPLQVLLTFEWSQGVRQIYTNGSKAPEGIEFWMGDSRGRWEGDTLVVNITNHNDQTWFDASGNFHSEEMTLVERYTMRDANTIQYQVTITDPKVFTRPWTMSMPLYRDTEMTRILEYDCQAEKEEANGAFPRDSRTFFPNKP